MRQIELLVKCLNANGEAQESKIAFNGAAGIMARDIARKTGRYRDGIDLCFSFETGTECIPLNPNSFFCSFRPDEVLMRVADQVSARTFSLATAVLVIEPIAEEVAVDVAVAGPAAERA